MLESCNLCPNNCNINRNKYIGKCGAGEKIKVALASLHYYEEPCISGENGSGTVFFSNCNLRCAFCQNYKISSEGFGKEIDVQDLANTFISLQNQNANNINLVTPTPYVPQIIEAIEIARQKGLNIPIIYNCGGYENVETIKMLDGYIDVYLPDLKYAENDIALKYSNVKNYFEHATAAILEMYNQVGAPKFDENGLIQKGLIIRHLVLPSHIENSKKVLKWINENIDKNVYVSIMAQYFPTGNASKFKEINRKLTEDEYKEIEEYLYSLEIENGYMQELEEHEEEYVPNFNLSGI